MKLLIEFITLHLDLINLSNSLLSDKIKISADSDNDLVFLLLVDGSAIEVLINTSINKFT